MLNSAWLVEYSYIGEEYGSARAVPPFVIG